MKNYISDKVWIWPALLSLILFILICILSGGFSAQTLMLNFTLMSFLIILGIGQMLVITSGNGAIDLSISNNIGFAAYICCYFTFGGKTNILAAVAITLLLTSLIGIINGLITVYLRIPAIITTLAVSYIVYTILLLLMPNVIGTPDAVLTAFTRFRICGVPIMTVLALVLVGIFSFVIFRTKYGYDLRSAGQSHEIARLAGVNVNRTLIITFSLSALCAGIAGILISAYTGGAYVEMGLSYHLPAIASVVVGGTLISGGKCSVVGVIFGAMMMTFLNTLMGVSQLSIGVQQLIQGVVLVLILAASVSGKKTNN